MDSDGICVLVQYLGVGRGSQQRQGPGRCIRQHPAAKGSAGPGEGVPGQVAERAGGPGSVAPLPGHQALCSLPELRPLILALGPSLSSLTRPSDKGAREGTKAAKGLVGANQQWPLSPHPLPRLSDGLWASVHSHPHPRHTHTHTHTRAGRLASAPSPVMIDRGWGNLGIINHRMLEPEEPSRPLSPTLPLAR